MAEEVSIETQIFVKLESMDGKLDTLVKTSGDHESRIRKLEKTIYYATGAAAVLGGLVGRVMGTGVI